MTFGITPNGFRAKTLDDVKLETEASLKQALGEAINLLPSAVLGQIVGITSERESKVWELAEGVYNSQYPLTSEGTILDNVVSITGVTRQPGTLSKATLYLFGTPGTIVPVGSVFSVLNDPTSRFVLNQAVTLVAAVNAVWDLDFDAVPDSGDFRLQYKGVNTLPIAFDATAQDVENALNGLSSLSSVVVAGDFSTGFTITGENGELFSPNVLTVTSNNLLIGVTPVVTTMAETTQGVPSASAIVEGESVPLEEGDFSAPSGALTVIENPITGLDSVVNPEDALLGRPIESDADLKLRREESLQRAGSSTLGAIVSRLADLENVLAVVGFENITFLVDGDGRNPKSFEVVVDGGVDADIAQLVWDTKPAGIEPVGDVSVGITDSQGFPQTSKFSRPTDVDIWVEVDLTTNAQFPANGVAQAQAAIVAFGNALGIGQKVIVYPQLICALNGIPGITDIALRIGTTASPTLDDNIDIAPDEISRWDSSRTAVVEL